MQNRPGVTSTIIGARRLDQLDDNIECLEVEIPETFLRALDEATKPTLPFPCDFVANMTGFYGNGANINGVQTAEFPISPAGDDDRY